MGNTKSRCLVLLWTKIKSELIYPFLCIISDISFWVFAFETILLHTKIAVHSTSHEQWKDVAFRETGGTWNHHIKWIKSESERSTFLSYVVSTFNSMSIYLCLYMIWKSKGVCMERGPNGETKVVVGKKRYPKFSLICRISYICI